MPHTDILVYYINTSEIPSELSRENFICSHVKIKTLANGFNICFNILSILLNGNVESVCHPPFDIVESMWKEFKSL